MLHSFSWNRIGLFVAITAAVLAVRYVLILGAARWLRFRGLLPKDYSLKKQFYPPLLVLLLPLVTQIVLPFFELPDKTERIVAHVMQITTILGVTWLFIRFTSFIEAILHLLYDLEGVDALKQRRLRTQIGFIHRLVLIVVCLVGFSAVLLSFDGARQLGASLIASAGVASVVIGFAAQKSLANLIAGFQIAFTQPLRIDDVVVVEKEFGRVEEITLTYVVIKLWDLRRLILPITYFVEKPFENWTRNSFELVGAVIVYADYHLPVDELRRELTRLVTGHALWNGKVCKLDVNGVTDRTLELRALVSANNHSDLSELRAFLRERLVGFIRERYPRCLPRERSEQHPPTV